VSTKELGRFLVVTCYKFVRIDDVDELRDWLLATCGGLGLVGTLIVAHEGINGTVAGRKSAVHALLAELRADVRFADLEHKESWVSAPPFGRLKVKVKAEIVTLGLPEVSPTGNAGTYVTPREWNSLILDPDVVVIDTRNKYETSLGTFPGALDPEVRNFGELPHWLAQHESAWLRPDGTRPKVAMFCTGGIRCEKSTALLRDRGYPEVFHLQGGILKYLAEVPLAESLWQGECFVFDERVSVSHGLTAAVDLPPETAADLASTPRKPPELPLLSDPVARLQRLASDAPADRRVLIALLGMPGSGKSTLVKHWHQELVAAGCHSISLLSMDGFHLTRAQLADLPDPDAALIRRGAPWTFDVAGIRDAICQISAGQEVAWPTFDHAVGDPHGVVLVPTTARVVVIEGLYLLHRRHRWDCAEFFDESWWVDVPTTLARGRAIARHQAANGNTATQAEQRWRINDKLNARIARASRWRANWRVDNPE
jgi:UPF0176 protein